MIDVMRACVFFLVFTLLSYLPFYGRDIYQGVPLPEGVEAWFTGPLLSGGGRVVPPGHTNLQPYAIVSEANGFYNEHWKKESKPHFISFAPYIYDNIGVCNRVDFHFNTNLTSNFAQGADDTRMGDTQLGFGFQVCYDKPYTAIPDMRVVIKQVFPTGHYNHLNPEKNFTDATGNGSYQTGLAVNLQKLFIFKKHLLRARFNFDYYYLAPVSVEGFNAYGGVHGTHGKVYPGNLWYVIGAFEYTLGKGFVFALDLQYLYQFKNRFSGIAGFNTKKHIYNLNFPVSQQFSIAPALEYNFNRNIGIIGGIWCSIAGKNAGSFFSGAISLNYYR